MRKAYRLYDVYEEKERIGSFSTFHEVVEACKKRDEETDGEWEPELYAYDSTVDKYRLVRNWTYEGIEERWGR